MPIWHQLTKTSEFSPAPIDAVNVEQLQAKIAKLEEESKKCKKELEESSSAYKVCVALKNGKIRELESALAEGTSTIDEIPSLRSLIALRTSSKDAEWARNRCFAVSPINQLILTPLGDASRPVGVVVVRNTSDRNVLFKLKAHPREKFLLFPSCGRLAPAATEIVLVIAHLRSDDVMTDGHEKIELRALQHDSINLDQFRKLWIETPQEMKAKHEIYCGFAETSTSS